MTKYCCIQGCTNEVQCPSTGTCKNCYQNILNWSKRRPDEVRKRAQRIGLYANRMQLLIPSNVDLMRPKKIKLKGMPGQIKYKKKNGKKRKTA